MKRPWTAWVRSIGPTFTFATEEAALARARDLVAADYLEVVVWGPVELPLRRRVVNAEKGEWFEQFDGGSWVRIEVAV